LNGFELYVIDHGIECIQDTFFILIREFRNIIQTFKHGGVFYYYEQIALPPYGDDPADQDMIKRGFRYYIMEYNKEKKDK
jgi:hypothetical protein